MRVPLIIAGPGIPAGESSALCYLYDIYPTLCELIGQTAPTVEGRSLVPIIRGEKPHIRESILCAYRDSQRMICNDEWKLITYPKIGHQQLFHLASDPYELNDLSGGSEHADRLSTLTRQLLALQREVGDPVLP